jgi:predicted signal transduction protein with EAL and GGDEF domain
MSARIELPQSKAAPRAATGAVQPAEISTEFVPLRGRTAARKRRTEALARIQLPTPQEPKRASNDRKAGQRYWRILTLCEIANFVSLRRHLGRARADSLLVDVAQRITALCPDARIMPVGRALIEIAFERDTPEAAASDIDRLRKAFQRKIDIDGEPYQLKMHFGIAAAPASEDDEVRLAEAAESALEQARAENRVVMLDLSRADLAFDKLTLMRELPRAIANGEMFLQYQPKVHVRRQQIASAEALIRWQHPLPSRRARSAR